MDGATPAARRRSASGASIIEALEALGDKVTRLEVTLVGVDGKNGLKGDVAQLKQEMVRLVGLRNMGRGVLIGAAIAAGIIILGVGGFLKAAAGGLATLLP